MKYTFTARTDKDHVWYRVVEASGKKEAIQKANELCATEGLHYDKGSISSKR